MYKRSTDEVKTLLDHGIDIVNRSVLLIGEVNEGMLDRVQTAKLILDAPGEEITVKICSGGGHVYEGFAIYDELRSCLSKITTIGHGKIMSMAVPILRAGDVALVTPNTTLMLHSVGSSSPYDYAEYLLRDANENMRIWRRYANTLAPHMNIKPTEFIRRYERNYYFTAEKAVELGLADRVLES